MKEIKITIKTCKVCPHFTEERMYTSDGWELAFNWFCNNGEKRKIRGYVEWHEGDKIEIPDWCPFNEKNLNKKV
jgi:hypothetical protein